MKHLPLPALALLAACAQPAPITDQNVYSDKLTPVPDAPAPASIWSLFGPPTVAAERNRDDEWSGDNDYTDQIADVVNAIRDQVERKRDPIAGVVDAVVKDALRRTDGQDVGVDVEQIIGRVSENPPQYVGPVLAPYDLSVPKRHWTQDQRMARMMDNMKRCQRRAEERGGRATEGCAD